ncbi:MAG: hypothetical protein VKK04_26275 [Synechococcales bacterium]|nr:hypothetical protein [Synechococcales bacterium]
MKHFFKKNRPGANPSKLGTAASSIPAEDVEKVLRLAAQFSVRGDATPVPVTDLLSAAADARIPPECVERAIAQVSHTQIRHQRLRQVIKRSGQVLLVAGVAIATALITHRWLEQTPHWADAPIGAPTDSPTGAAATVRTLDARSGWQIFEFDTPVRKITGIVGEGSPGHGHHSQVGPGGHQGREVWRPKPWNPHEQDAKLPADTLLIELADKTAYPVNGPMEFSVPVQRVRMRVEAKSGFSIANDGSFKVYFE